MNHNNPIRLKYFIRVPNVGDLISPHIVTALSGRETFHDRKNHLPHLIATGSLMAASNNHSFVWGTGIMHPDIGLGSPDPSHIYALRGKLSYSEISKKCPSLDDIPLGDPGYLAPKLLGIKRAAIPKFRIGIVAHYVDRANPLIKRMLIEYGVIDLDVHSSPISFLKQMAECEVVVSTSLHGLIFAEALGIPNLWVKAGDDIAGGDFKFQDWFSMTDRPQSNPHLLTQKDNLMELHAKAQLHECAIDIEALIGAFPKNCLPTIEEPINKPFYSVTDCRSHPVPIFFISFNRGAMLKKAITSVQMQSKAVEIIIHDNGSNDPETIDILDKLEAENIKVFRHRPINCADDLNFVNETVEYFFSIWAEPSRYVVSDCDIDMSISDPLSLDVYDTLLNQFYKVSCVGPMLRIQDIPEEYPLYSHVVNRHIEQFWRRIPHLEITKFGFVAFINARIDTTFALHRAGENFRRLKDGLRIYEPFEALHLDWYKNQISDTYTETSNPNISHWNNKKTFNLNKNATIGYSQYYIVKKLPDGILEITKIEI